MVSFPNEYPWTTSSPHGTMIENDILQTHPHHPQQPHQQQQHEATEHDFPLTNGGATYPDHCFFIQRISYGSVQRSLLLLLNILSQNYSSISNWYLFLYPMIILRDFTLLPLDLILFDPEGNDLLPSNVRQEFEFHLHTLDRQDKQRQQDLLAAKNAKEGNQGKDNEENTRKSSFFALQLLGEALFGSSNHSSQRDFGNKDNEEENNEIGHELIKIINEKYNVRTSRWDSGYEGVNSLTSSTSGSGGKDLASASLSPSNSQSNSQSYLGQRIAHHNNTKPQTPRPNIHPDHNPFAKTVKWDVDTMRGMISKTNISSIITESKFLPDDHLLSLLKSIIKITEAHHYHHDDGAENPDLLQEIKYELNKDDSHSFDASAHNPLVSFQSSQQSKDTVKTAPIHYYRNSENFLDTSAFISLRRIHSFTSAASISWLEMILVEISLRNRDRFSLYWPVLKLHYQKCLGTNFTKLSYVAER
jgi:hypothetical protein